MYWNLIWFLELFHYVIEPGTLSDVMGVPTTQVEAERDNLQPV